MSATDEQLLHTKLNLETAQIAWKDLLRYFAGGTVIEVAENLDLVEVAAQMASDNVAVISDWLADKRIARVSDEQAKTWLDTDAQLWAVVVKPWILVQQKRTMH